MIKHRACVTTLAVFVAIGFAPTAEAGVFDNVINKMGDTVNKRTEDLGQRAVDGAFDTADDAIDCAAGDENCARRVSAEQTAAARTVKPDGPARCVATDIDCLQDAKKRGLKVEIVDESELDTIRCPISDTACMQRAKKAGKKIELID
jgi:hypothetical protein